ncbi:MAG: hypothetical protein ACLU23_05145 [Eubacterium sp.]
MKKLTSILLSAIIMLTAVVGFDLTAYAGSYDTTAKAKSYTLGTTTTGYFSSNDDIDFLKVDVPQSGRIDFTAEGTKSYYVYIYPSNATEDRVDANYIHYNDNLGKAYSECYAYLVAGTYYFKVDGIYDNSSYTISSSFTPANESFPESLDVNNNIIGNANPISLDTTYNGMLGENDDIDFYSFTVPSGTQIINISANENIYFSVYSMTGERIAGSWYVTKNDSTGVASKSESVSLDAGTYCLKIEKGTYSCFYSFSINSPHQHSYNYAYTVKSTYTSQGYDVYTCSCGASYTTNYKAVKKLGKVNLKSVSSARKRHTIKASWNKKSGANGYQIYYSRNKNFKKLSAKKIVKGGKKNFICGQELYKGQKVLCKSACIQKCKR